MSLLYDLISDLCVGYTNLPTPYTNSVDINNDSIKNINSIIDFRF
jgi:hypothetical protein